jgi:hypothetical protein
MGSAHASYLGIARNRVHLKNGGQTLAKGPRSVYSSSQRIEA